MRVILDEGAYMPNRFHATDAGLDIMAKESQWVLSKGSAVFHTGVHVELPTGTAGLLVSKSGLNVNHDITSTGLIDEGYDGEIVVKLFNHGKRNYKVEAGDKISQLVVIPVVYESIEVVDSFDHKTERGSGGFGSTGKHAEPKAEQKKVVKRTVTRKAKK